VTVTVRGDDIAQVEIIDHGIGIPEAEMGRVGERFFRASNASVVPGSGLGLAIARELLGRHHGALAIESTEGRGTRVTVSWPREVGN
jgi:signal transduction histidine kinase